MVATSARCASEQLRARAGPGAGVAFLEEPGVGFSKLQGMIWSSSIAPHQA